MKPFPDLPTPDKPKPKDLSTDPDQEICVLCKIAQNEYESGETFLILNAYIMAVGSGYTPPDWVLEGLNEAFTKCLQSDGKQSLDATLGLKAPGRGRTVPMKENRQQLARTLRAVEIHTLVAHLSIKPEEAAHMVLSREAEPWESADDDTPSIAWLVEDYRRKYRDKLPPTAQEAQEVVVEKEYLKIYPEWSWPRQALIKYKRAQYIRPVKI